jgi:hypothetical protein
MAEPIVGIGSLEEEAILPSMDSHRRIIQAQEVSCQSIPQPTSLGSEFSQNSKDKAVESNPTDCTSIYSINNEISDIDDSSLANFLDVMAPTSPNSLTATGSHSMDFFIGRDVFKFGMESSLDFDENDCGWISSQNARQPVLNYNTAPELERERLVRDNRTPDMSACMSAGAEAFAKSLWKWPLAYQDAHAEHVNPPSPDIQSLEPRYGPDILDQTLDQTTRDRILAILLNGCKPSNLLRVVTCFPSTGLLDALMHSFFRSEVHRTNSWIHLPTISLHNSRPELISIIIAAGAILETSPAIRKFGYAIQEAIRLAIPAICEKDNRTTRDLQIVQAHALELNIGLWSGNKRKMEHAEDELQPLVIRLQRAGHYRRKPPMEPPQPDDHAEALEAKWRAWVEAESFKRLAFYTLIHDAQASICLQTRPLVSYTQMSLELPYSLELWRAKTASEWRDVYLRMLPNILNRLPSLAHCIHDIQSMSRVEDYIDLQFSTLAILYGICSLVFGYRQLEFHLKTQVQAIQDYFSRILSGLDINISQEAHLLQELYMMNRYVSFEELQLFAGKEGSEEAHRVMPLLQHWYNSPRSRQAIYFAGQILRAADLFPSNHLRDFYAVALYYSALCFWVYGVYSIRSNEIQNLVSSQIKEPIWLNGEESADTRRFVFLGRGIPMIREPSRLDEDGGRCRVDDPEAVMETIIHIMSKNCSYGSSFVPPLVENLRQLMRDLGNAAGTIRK